jgi:hypothetical protein
MSLVVQRRFKRQQNSSSLEFKGSNVHRAAAQRRTTEYKSTRQFSHLFDLQGISVTEVCLCCDVMSLNTRCPTFRRQVVSSFPRVSLKIVPPVAYTKAELDYSYLGKKIGWECCAMGCWGKYFGLRRREATSQLRKFHRVKLRDF